MAEDGRVSARDVAFQEERAAGGVGLIVFGGTAVHPTSRFPARILIESWDEAVVESLRVRAEAVHRHGAAIFGQLIHLGREAPGGLTEGVPLAPSAIASPRNPTVPHEMTDADIREIVEAFGRSAANYAAAGIDGVEIHARARLPRRAVPLAGVEPAPRRLPRRHARGADALSRRDRRGDPRALRPRLPRRRPAQRRRAHARRADARRHARDRRRAAGGGARRLPVDHDRATRRVRQGLELGRGVRARAGRGGEGARRRAGDRRRPDPPARPRRAGARGGPGRLRRRRPRDARRLRSGSPRRATGRCGRIRPCIGIVQDCRRYAGGVDVHDQPATRSRGGVARARSGGSRVAPRRRRRRRPGRPRGGARRRRGGPRRRPLRARATSSAASCGRPRPGRHARSCSTSSSTSSVSSTASVSTCGSAPPATRADVVAAKPDLVVVRNRGGARAPRVRRRRRRARRSPSGTCSVAVGEIPQRAVVVDDGERVLAGSQRRRVPGRAGRGRRAGHAGPGSGARDPAGERRERPPRLRSNGVRFRALSQVARVDGTTVLARRRGHGRAGRDVRPTSSSCGRASVSRTAFVAELAGTVPALVAIGDCAAPRRLNHAVLEANLALRRFDEGRLGATSLVLF